MPTQRFEGRTVVEAARARIAQVFDLHARGAITRIIVSISGGKDSTVLAYLALAEAQRRNVRIGLFFLDEEVVYESTVAQVQYLMGLAPACTIPYWLQIPFALTNATSLTESQLLAWEPGKHALWMRPKLDFAIKARPWDPGTETVRDRNKGFGFYDVIENFERMFTGAAFLVGVRATESMHRWSAVTKHPITVDGERIFWGTRRGANHVLYPLYDWNFHDVWRFIHDEGIRYSRIYDLQFRKGYPVQEARVSSLIHERSFKALCDLPEFEPKTYERLVKRLKGISLAQETARDARLFRARKLPKNFTSWRAYRDFLLATYPDPARRPIFERRFARHLDNEFVARQQVRQLVLGDYEDNVPVQNGEDPREALIRYYDEVL